MSPTAFPRISVIIPAYNEEESLGLVLKDMPWNQVQEVIVVANACTDRTEEVAAAGGARVISEPRKGYGTAVLAGLAAMDRPDVVVIMDADFSDHPDELPKVVDPIVKDRADFVIGSRPLGNPERGALLLQARFGNALATTLIRWLLGFRYTDLGPFRAIRAESLAKLGMCDPNFGWNVEMQMKAIMAGLRIVEVPVSYRKRAGGMSKVSGTVSGTFRAGYKILRTIWKYRKGEGFDKTGKLFLSEKNIEGKVEPAGRQR